MRVTDGGGIRPDCRASYDERLARNPRCSETTVLVHRYARGRLGTTGRAHGHFVLAPIGLNDCIFVTNNRAVNPIDMTIGEENVSTIRAVDVARDKVGG